VDAVCVPVLNRLSYIRNFMLLVGVICWAGLGLARCAAHAIHFTSCPGLCSRTLQTASTTLLPPRHTESQKLPRVSGATDPTIPPPPPPRATEPCPLLYVARLLPPFTAHPLAHSPATPPPPPLLRRFRARARGRNASTRRRMPPALPLLLPIR
jgi:hypothetical protein